MKERKFKAVVNTGDKVNVSMDGTVHTGVVIAIDPRGSLEVQEPCADVVVEKDGREELVKHVPLSKLTAR